jgi:hypothetical protein
MSEVDHHTLAVMSKAAYAPTSQGAQGILETHLGKSSGWSVVTPSTANLETTTRGGMRVQRDGVLTKEPTERLTKASLRKLSGLTDTSESRTHTSFEKDGKLVVAFRGTDLNNKTRRKSDLKTDANIGLTTEEHTSRFKSADSTTRTANNLYGRENVTLTGHSLGGSLGISASKKHKNNAVVFNPGHSPLDVSTPLSRKQKQITAYTTLVDPISGSIVHDKRYSTKVRKPTQKDVHGIDNFIRKP